MDWKLLTEASHENLTCQSRILLASARIRADAYQWGFSYWRGNWQLNQVGSICYRLARAAFVRLHRSECRLPVSSGRERGSNPVAPNSTEARIKKRRQSSASTA